MFLPYPEYEDLIRRLYHDPSEPFDPPAVLAGYTEKQVVDSLTPLCAAYMFDRWIDERSTQIGARLENAVMHPEIEEHYRTGCYPTIGKIHGRVIMHLQ